MEFKKTEIAGCECYILNDTHKCVKYGEHWFAYFKPKGWKSFGNSCRLELGESKKYTSLEDAKKECLTHLEKYGEYALSNCRL